MLFDDFDTMIQSDEHFAAEYADYQRYLMRNQSFGYEEEPFEETYSNEPWEIVYPF